jgi:phosphoribosylaminoimidazolecarboxamide formyltransferase/IMP cyclohydrolase
MNRVTEVDDRIPVRRVLVSVSDKTGLAEFAEALSEIESIRIYSTGGTYLRLVEILGSRASTILRQVSDYTGQPEMQGGLVKTLDFKIYLGLLSEPYNEDHRTDRERVGAELIDMVVANLYPFASVVARAESDLEDARGNIDIGGPTMVRAAAKSYLRVASVCDPEDYPGIIQELADNDGTLGLQTRLGLARKAFAHTAHYDAAIADYFDGVSDDDAARGYTVH